MDRCTGKHTEKQTDNDIYRQIKRHTERLKDGLRNKQTHKGERLRDSKTYKQTDIQSEIDIHTILETDRQTDTERDRQTDIHPIFETDRERQINIQAEDSSLTRSFLIAY